MTEKIKLRPRALGWEYLNKIENPLCALGYFSGYAIRRISGLTHLLIHFQEACQYFLVIYIKGKKTRTNQIGIKINTHIHLRYSIYKIYVELIPLIF